MLPVVPIVKVPTLALVAKVIALATFRLVVPIKSEAALVPVVLPNVTPPVPKAALLVAT